MPILKKSVRLSKHEYYETHLALVNCILPATITKITPKEIEVLARFMGMEGDIANDRFGTSARKLVKQDLNITDGGLGNYMSSLKKKGFIYNHPQQGLIIHPLLNCDKTEQMYNFKLENVNS